MSEFVVSESARIFSWRQCYWCGGVAGLGYETSAPWLDDFKRDYGLVSVEFYPKSSDLEVNITLLNFETVTYIGIEGTRNFFPQAMAYTFEGRIGQRLDPDMFFLDNFFVLGQYAALAIQSKVSKAKNLVICGHSLGGACSTIASELLKRAGYNVRAVWTYGSPRPANQAFKDRYTIPAFRCYSSGDLVTTLPPSWNYLFDGPAGTDIYNLFMRHIGTDVAITGTDPEEAIESTWYDVKRFGLYKLWDRVSQHFLGSYLEGIYSKLSDDEKSWFSSLFNVLVAAGSHGVPSAPPGTPTSTPPADLVTGSFASEETKLRSMIGPAGKIKAHLFTAPAYVPEIAAPEAFTAPAFPGYAPATIPAETKITADSLGLRMTEQVELTFTCSAPPASPVVVVGCWVSCATGDGGAREVVEAKLLSTPRTITAAGDRVKVRIRLTCAQTGS